MTFEELKKTVTQPTAVLFYGQHCGPCARLKPKLRSILGDKLVEIDAATEMEVVRTLAIRGVPTVVAVYPGGRVEKLWTGDATESAIKTALRASNVIQEWSFD